MDLKKCMTAEHFPKFKIEDIAFYGGYALFLVWKITASSVLAIPEGSLLNTAVHFISLAMLSVSVFFSFKRDVGMAPYAIAILLGIAVKVFADSMLFFDLSILLLAARHRSFRSICVATLAISGSTIAAIVGLSLCGVVANYPFSRGEVVRWGLGFRWTTFLSHYYLNLVMLYIFIRRDKTTTVELIAIALIDLLIYLATDSRNSFVLVLVVVIAVFAWRLLPERLLPKLDHLKRLATQYLLIALVAGFFIASVLYNPSSAMFQDANDILSNRLQQTHESIETYGLKPFGSEIEWASKGVIGMGMDSPSYEEGDVNYVDNSFIELLLNTGYIPFLVVMGWLLAAGSWAAKHEGWLVCFYLLVIAVHSTVDPQLLLIEYNTFLFLIMEMAVKQYRAASELLSNKV